MWSGLDWEDKGIKPATMDGDEVSARGRCPRCVVCGAAVRVRGVGSDGVWCAACIGGALPFAGIVGEGEYRGALREYQEGLGSRAGDFLGLRLDPYDDETIGSKVEAGTFT